MIRGTDDKFTFKLPCTKENLQWATIKIWQPGNPSDMLPISKRLEHCSAPEGSNELCVSLTAEETKRFSDKYKGKVQMRAQRTDTGTVIGTKPRLFTVYPMLDDIIADDAQLPLPENINDWVILDGEAVMDQSKSKLNIGDAETISSQ